MGDKQVMLEVATRPVVSQGSAEAGPSRDQAVRQAKSEFLTAARRLDYFDSRLEVIGEKTTFPVLVFSGPGAIVDDFSDRIQGDLPDLVRSIERDTYVTTATPRPK